MNILNLKIFDRFFTLSEEDKKILNHVRSIRRKYPSIRVVGRGTIVIDPKEIIESEQFKKDLQNTKHLMKA